MARPKLEIGTYGEIAVKEESPGSWRATARYRDLDGTTRLVKAYGQSESKAKAALKSKLKKRRRGPGGVDAELTPDSTVAELLKHWLSVCESEYAAAVRAGGHPVKSEGTIFHYRRCAEKVVIPALGENTLRELSTPRVDRFLRELEGNVKMARTVLSQACTFAIRYGAMEYSPCSLRSSPRGRPAGRGR
ncbi:hypothetical protein [Tsukamurella soli]|uniref:hypothetical protein n=1 Tax=Tsukamurella soli TaxID=644556 RepID=UPI003606E7BD